MHDKRELLKKKYVNYYLLRDNSLAELALNYKKLVIYSKIKNWTSINERIYNNCKI
jgi:predicted DNA-binding protein YlxM (UPF0122 family)